jgi:hypothetical protein
MAKTRTGHARWGEASRTWRTDGEDILGKFGRYARTRRRPLARDE